MSNLRVLVVEDSEDDAALLLRTLKRGGYTVTYERVETAPTMKAALKSQEWDIVISDYSMPNFNAPAALSVLKESAVDLPFIIVSGTIGEETAVAALKAGAHDFLLKGDMPRLIPAIERELRDAEQRRARQQAEEALRESESRYRRMFEATRAIKLMVDPQTWEIIDANPAATEFYGYTREELVARKLVDITLSPQQSLFEQMALALAGQTTAYVFSHQLASGEQRDVELYPSPLDLQGQTVIYCIIHDITERQQAQDELAALYNATSFLMKADSLLSLGHQIVQAVVQDFQQADCGLLLVDKTDKTMIRLARAGELGVDTHNVLRLDGTGLVPTAVRTRKIVYAPDVSENPEYLPNNMTTRSELVVPLQTAKGVLGVLDLQSNKLNAFNHRDQRILGAFAERAAAAIEIIQLYEEINRHAAELELRVLERTAELRRTKDHVEAILNNTSDAIVLSNFDGIIRQVNPAVGELLGYQGDELFGHSLFTFVTPEYTEIMLDALQTVVKDKQWARIEMVVHRKDGTSFDADIALAPIMEGEKIRDIVFSLRDMTQHKQMEYALRESEARYRRLAENAQDIIYRYRTSQPAGFEYVSPASATILGYTPEEHYANPNLWLSLTDANDKSALETLLVSRQTHSEPLILRWRRKDGTIVWIEQRNAFVRDDDGNVIAIEGISRDISERKRIEEGLREALEKEKELNELKTRFVSMVSHDFRTPLAVIQSSTDMLQRYNAQLDESQKLKRFDKIRSQIQRMVALLNDVLTINRADAGAMPFFPITLDLNVFAREIAEEFQNAPDMKHTLLYSSSQKEIYASVDEKLLHHAIINLLTNAIKYSPEGTTIRFNLESIDDEIMVRVTDSGIGIPQSDHKHLFETFHRAANVGTIEGTGLGLAIVKRAIDIHGGKIDFASEVGVGTSFTITLPKGQANADEAQRDPR